MSCAIQTRGTWIQPLDGSTCTSTIDAVYEYVGEGPTPPPLNRAADFGGAYDPVVPIVPNFASAMQTASAKLTPLSGLCGASASNTRRPANTRPSPGPCSFSDTACTSRSRARSAP